MRRERPPSGMKKGGVPELEEGMNEERARCQLGEMKEWERGTEGVNEEREGDIGNEGGMVPEIK